MKKQMEDLERKIAERLPTIGKKEIDEAVDKLGEDIAFDINNIETGLKENQR